MRWEKEHRSSRRSNTNNMGGQLSKHDIIRYRSGTSSVDGTKEPPNDDGGGGGGGLTFLLSFLRRRKTKNNESYCMDATTSRFFHGDTATSQSASCSNDSVVSTNSDRALQRNLSSSQSSTAGDSSSTASNEDNHMLSHNYDCRTRCNGSDSNEKSSTCDHNPTTACCVDDYLIYSTDSDSFVDRYGILNGTNTEIGALSRSSSTIDSIIDDLLKSQDRSGFKKAISPSMQAKKQIHIHPFGNSSASVCSQGTLHSILSTATPFCVFNDDDNNTVVSYKVVHRPIYENERHITHQNLAGFENITEESSNEIQYSQNVEDIVNRFGNVPAAVSNHHGLVSDVWSSNWNEMYDDDSITSAGTILKRTLQQSQHEVVLVRSKYSYAQEDASRLNGNKKKTSRKAYWNCDDDPDYNFPWDAYKEAISSEASHAMVKKTKSSSRYLPHYFDRPAYALVEV